MAFSCPNQDKSLCLFASPSEKGSTHTNSLVGVTTHGENTDTQLPPNADTDVDLSDWIPALFITQAYKQQWEEWKEYLFCRSALTYRGMINPKYKVPDNTVSILTDVSILLLSLSIGNSLSLFHLGR